MRLPGFCKKQNRNCCIQAKALGIEREAFQHFMESMSHTRRSTTLKEVTDAAVFLASDLAAGMTGTVVNLTI